MAKIIEMPKMGNTVKTVIFSEWYVKEGQEIKVGDKFFSYETDKTSIDEESKEEGVVLKLLVNPNDEIPVFSPIAIIGKEGEDISKILEEIEKSNPKKEEKKAEEPKEEAKVVEKPVAEVKQVEKPAKPVSSQSQGQVNISPRAIRALAKSGIPIEAINYGTGPKGRIVAKDVANAMSMKNLTSAFGQQANPALEKINEIINAPTNDGEFEYGPMRKAIAKAMLKSQDQSAPTTLSLSVDASKLMAVRETFKKNVANGGPNISINDLLVYALSRTLGKYSSTINAHVFDDKAIAHANVNIAIAVDTKGGLIVPVLKDANTKTLEEISNESKFMIQEVRKGDYKNVDLKSGTFTISNVGAMNIEMFTPVLNDGQAAILGVGAVTLRARKNTSGLIEFYNSMILSLTIDHRLADGADGARFLNDLKLVLENIDLIL